MIKAKIRNIYDTLTPTEQRIADMILSEPSAVTGMTAKELAARCKTVPSAVDRMSKSVGTDGFSRLKLELAAELGRAEPFGETASPGAAENAKEILKAVFSSGIKTLENTFYQTDPSVCERIAKMIAESQRVYVFGVGTSSVIAQDAAYRFSQLGAGAYAYTDILYMGVAAKNMRPEDSALMISHSGTTKAVVDAMRSAKSAGAKTAAVTSFEKSILYKECDEAICVYADEEDYPAEAVSARIAHMCVIDALMMMLASFDKKSRSKHLSARNSALREIRY